MTHFIYALYSTRDGAIRYVGQTATPNTRLSRDRENRRVHEWMDKEPWFGHRIERAILETCDYEDRILRELTYMAKFEDLLNGTNKDIIGFYRNREDSENKSVLECRRAIECFRKSVDWNYEGFTGIARWNRSSAFPIYRVQASIKYLEEYDVVDPQGVKKFIDVQRYHTEYLPDEFEEFAKAVEARDAALERLKPRFRKSSVYPDDIDRV